MFDKYKHYLIILCLMLTSCVTTSSTTQKTAQTKQYTEQELEDSFDKLVSCKLKNISEIDDGLSDAKSIAIGLSARCGVEYNQFLRMYAIANLENSQQVRMFIEMNQKQDKKIERFIETVLDYRAWLLKQNP